MRRVLVLLPLALVGCRLGRQAAVSADGRVASTIESGTFISGRGRIADGGDDLAWSPDGQTLAIAAKDGVIFWPKGDPITGMQRPLAFSPFGDELAGMENGHVKVKNLTTGEVRTADIEGPSIGLRWIPDGRILTVSEKELEIVGGPKLKTKENGFFDAVGAADGTVTYLQWEKDPKSSADLLTLGLRLGRWNPADGSSGARPLAKADTMFGAPSARRLDVPVAFALAPDGTRLAAAGVRIETGARNIARIKLLAAKTSSTDAEKKEMESILGAARTTELVIRLDLSGNSETLWSSPVTREQWSQTDLSWSSDGAWLAIAGKDGTVRVAADK